MKFPFALISRKELEIKNALIEAQRENIRLKDNSINQQLGQIKELSASKEIFESLVKTLIGGELAEAAKLGHLWASSPDSDQAEFLNAAATVFRSWGPANADMQQMYVYDKLSDDAKWLLEKWHDWREFNEEESTCIECGAPLGASIGEGHQCMSCTRTEVIRSIP